MLAEKLAGSGAAAKTYIEDVFVPYVYTGNGGAQTVNVGFQPDLAWIKNRDTGGVAYSHVVFDSARGGNMFDTSASTAQSDYSGVFGGFSSTGFSYSSSDTSLNQSAKAYIAWCFKKKARFIDIVTWTGNGTTQTINHNLGVAPGMVVLLNLTSGGNREVWHRSSTFGYHLSLNATGAETNVNSVNRFGNNTVAVDPTATTLTVGSNANYNANGALFVAYLFAHDTSTDGLIQCGSFTTDASGNAPDLNLGWEPQFLMFKQVNTTGAWYTLDTMRGWSVGSSDLYLNPNASSAEATLGGSSAPTATGCNVSGMVASSTCIYLAIRRGPMKPPTSGTQVYKTITYTGDGTNSRQLTGVGFPPDLVASFRLAGSNSHVWFDRLRGKSSLATDSTNAEVSAGGNAGTLLQDGVMLDWSTSVLNNSGHSYVANFFRRYPGVFDMVCRTGTGSTTTVAHNLGVAPELIISKNRSAVADWKVYIQSFGVQYELLLDSTSALLGPYNPGSWGGALPTASFYSVSGSGWGINQSGNNYVDYLFATLAGVSKVGSYTGNGTSQTINCGFAAGARFVLIKRTDSTGDWYVWDTVRGIVAANDPHLSLNTTAAEVTTDDSVDPASSGFIVNQLAATNINVNAATYIYLSLA